MARLRVVVFATCVLDVSGTTVNCIVGGVCVLSVVDSTLSNFPPGCCEDAGRGECDGTASGTVGFVLL